MRRVIIALVVLFLIAQFIRPDTSLPNSEAGQDLILQTEPSVEVADLLRASCYDCHSNETKYPWYVSITPVNWWMQQHVNEGREEFNMSEWGGHKAKWQRHKSEEAVELVKKGEMPLDSYTWGHPEARLSDGQRAALTSYFSELMMAIPDQRDGREPSHESEGAGH